MASCSEEEWERAKVGHWEPSYVADSLWLGWERGRFYCDLGFGLVSSDLCLESSFCSHHLHCLDCEHSSSHL